VWMQLGLEPDRRDAAEIIHSIHATRSRHAPSRSTASASAATMTSPRSRRGSTNSLADLRLERPHHFRFVIVVATGEEGV
jgi:hypothetical protein